MSSSGLLQLAVASLLSLLLMLLLLHGTKT